MSFIFRRFHVRDFAKLSFFLLVMALGGFIFLGTPELMPSTLLSVICFFAFSPLVNFFERRGFARPFAILMIFVFSGSLIAIGVTSFIPRLRHEVYSIKMGTQEGEPGYLTKLHEREIEFTSNLPFPGLKDINLTEKGVQWLRSSEQDLLRIIPDLASHVMMIFLLVPLLTFMLLKDADAMKLRLLALVPNRHFETVYGITWKIIHQLGGFVAARLLEALIILLMVTIPCLIFKIPYAFLLGLFAAATNAIPYIGPLIGAVPGLLFALGDTSGHSHLFTIFLIYLAANLVDMIVVFPVVVGRLVDLHPLIVVISVVLGSQFLGILGMILAVPMASALKILIQEFHSRLYQ